MPDRNLEIYRDMIHAIHTRREKSPGQHGISPSGS
jgi:hypothetical protein